MFLDIDKKPADRTAALDDRGGALTYGQLAGACATLEGVLPPRQLVFCLCENTVGALAAALALYQNRQVALLLDARIDPQLLERLDATFGPSHYCYPEALAPQMAKKAPTELARMHGMVLAATGAAPCALHPELSMLLTTSGTTGEPKLVRHKYGNLEANAANVAAAFGWSAAERPLCDLPMQYTMGLNVMYSNLFAGATLLLCGAALTSGAYWSFLKEQQATSLTGVPYSYEILDKLRFTRMDLPHLATLSVGGGKLSLGLFEQFSAWAKARGKRFFSTFGTTETSARCALLPPELATEKPGSIGRALAGGSLLLRDEAGTELPNGPAEGELCYRGPNVTMGYALSREDLALGDVFCGEYRTGDLARRDADGCYTITGRRSRFLKLFGLRVSLDQCEALVKEAFPTGCACMGTDEAMEVFVTGGAPPEQVQRFLSDKTHLPPAVYQVRVVERIPVTAAGKTDYRALRAANA